MISCIQAHGEPSSLNILCKIFQEWKDREIRCCAIYSHFDVYLNINGYSEAGIKSHQEFMEAFLIKEKDVAVKAAYLRNLYWPKNEWAARRLVKLLEKYQKLKKVVSASPKYKKNDFLY